MCKHYALICNTINIWSFISREPLNPTSLYPKSSAIIIIIFGLLVSLSSALTEQISKVKKDIIKYLKIFIVKSHNYNSSSIKNLNLFSTNTKIPEIKFF